MGILKHITGALTIGVAFIGLQCSINRPITSNEAGFAVEISAAATGTQTPSELDIHLSDGQGFEVKQVVSPVGNNGKCSFMQIPYGYYCIDIVGLSQQLRTLYGHSELDVQGPNPSVNVFLRNIIGVQNLADAQEQIFLQNGNQRSVFWDALVKKSTALCTTVDGKNILRVTVAASALYLYFLCEVTDTLFFPEHRPLNGMGEFTSDALVVYLCKIPPHEMTQDKQPFPAVRFQCEVGQTIIENGVFDLTNFTTDFTKNGPLLNFITEEIRAKIYANTNQRILELRIRKPLLALPDGVLDQTHLFGMVVRYRNSNNATLPAVLSDWQSGTAETNPRFADGSWGYLEVNP